MALNGHYRSKNRAVAQAAAAPLVVAVQLCMRVFMHVRKHATAQTTTCVLMDAQPGRSWPFKCVYIEWHMRL
eukprot:6198939-Pleurochrysis_carterae.AAC.3